MYVMMDGAPVNRSLVKEIQKRYGSYSMPNPNTKDDLITFIMDPKVSRISLPLLFVYLEQHLFYSF